MKIGLVILSLRTLGEYNDLESDEQLKALVFKSAAEENGDYLGDPLDVDRCRSLRMLLGLRYAVD